MVDGLNRTIKSSQEQAVAAWITNLNQIRLDTLIESLDQQDDNQKEALACLGEIKKFVANPNGILGSQKTKHGEIAENMQVNISNARQVIKGLDKRYTFEGVGRTAPEDYIRDGQQVQSKFYNGLRNTFFGSNALEKHFEKYPDFLKNGGSYDIPKDQYEKMLEILDKYKNNPSQLSTGDYNLAKKINEFLQSNGLELGKDIKPAVVNYREVQLGAANQTVDKEEKNIKKEDRKQREKAYNASKPSLKEGAKIAGVSAAAEGGVTFCMAVAKKRKEKMFCDFTSEDWKEIGIDTGKGATKGGIRGGSIYLLSNFTATPANVASAYVTAAFGVASQVKALEGGNISAEDFIINCETICLDVTISAIASVAGQIIIPIPVLGAVMGNIAGEFVYELCKKVGSTRSKQIIEGYNTEMTKLEQQLAIQYLQVLLEIKKALWRFNELEKLAFDLDVNQAFIASASLAAEVGVADTKILKSKENIDCFFMQ